MDAAPLAMTKATVEVPLVSAAMSLSTLADRNRTQLANATHPQTWGQLAQFYAAQTHLDENSKALMRSKNSAYQSPTNTKAFDTLVQNFERVMAIDTVRNEYLLHSQLHQWLADGNPNQTLQALNEKVYAELFLTPSSDPWLGLVSPEVYSAIEGDGIQHP